MKNLVIQKLLPYIVLTLIVLIGHGWLIFNQSTNWDDWLIKGFLDDGNWSELRNMTSEMGLPILAYFFWSLKLLGLAGSYKLVSLVLILLSSFVIFEIGLRSGLLHRTEALLIAVIATVYPAFQTSILLSTLQYEFFYFLFLLAALIYLISTKELANSRLRFLLLGLSFVLFYVSFNLNSLLAYYFVFLGCLILNEDQVRGRSYFQKFQFALLYRWHFLLLPFIYWGVKKIAFPTHGLYANYNHLRFEGVVGRMTEAIQVEAFTPLLTSIGYLSEYRYMPLLILLASGFAYFMLGRRKDMEQFSDVGNAKKLWWLLIIGVVLMICGMVPYAIAGHVPSRSGWDSRHAILAGLPVAMMLTATIRWMYVVVATTTRLTRTVISVAAIFFGAVLIMGFVISTASYYSAHQLRAIKDESVMAKLQSQDSLKAYSTFWIDDRFLIAGVPPYYNYYEWSSMFKAIWGGQSRVGIPLHYAGRSLPHELPDKMMQSQRYNLADFDPLGRQVCLSIQPGLPEIPESKLVRMYMYLQFKSMLGMENDQANKRFFLQEITRVSAKELHHIDPLKGCSLLYGFNY